MTQVASTVVVQFWKRFTSLSVTIPSKKGEGLEAVVVGMVVAEDVVVPMGVVMDAVDVLEVVMCDSSTCTYNK
jgi:threonine/homoserine efflux transporter RhtA